MLYKNKYFHIVISYAVILILYIEFAQEEYDIYSKVLGWFLFVICTIPLLNFLINKYNRLPFIELVLLAYVNAFSLPMFFEAKNTIMVKVLYPSTQPVNKTLIYVIIAVISLYAGYYGGKLIFNFLKLPQLKLNCKDNNLYYLGLVICITHNAIRLAASEYEGLENIANILISPDLGIALLALIYYKNNTTKIQKISILLALSIIIIQGIIIGMTQLILQPLVIWFVCRWLITRKLEVKYIIIGILLFLLLQPVKLGYRSIAWKATSDLSNVEKIELFTTLFYSYWINPESAEIIESAMTKESSTTRTSLLLQTTHVIDWTPSIVDYKYGDTLYFMLVTWVPRYFWKEKPIAQQSNIDYAIDYGITTIEGIKRTMFGVGHLGEVYMNFGEAGIIPIFFILGIITYIPIYLLILPQNNKNYININGENSGIATIALLVAILIKILIIGSTIADSYGSLIQMIIVQGSLMHLIAGKNNSNKY